MAHVYLHLFLLNNKIDFMAEKAQQQNVLAAINFSLKFTYVLAGWEGYAHDSRILNDALERPQGFQIPQDKYYLVDAGYGLREGFIPPYHGVRYHLQEYSDRPPQKIPRFGPKKQCHSIIIKPIAIFFCP